MKEIIDLFLHLPVHLEAFINAHGTLVYGLLFLIIFCETGLVITPFLPGDSLLFAIGAIAATPGSALNIWYAAIILLVAAILGDTVNYWIGRKFGGWTMRTFPRIVKPSHIAKTNEFFVRYGGKTIIIARFVPIVRTFAPFVAGSGEMDYKRFMFFNVIGALLWVGLILPAGWIFGNIPIIKDNFELVVLGIIAVSILPMVIEIAKAKFRKAPEEEKAE
ncbi:DedA family protein [Luteolibacter yonseiensis]|uniref:DedA family protein n=1 Tax=Luteolibacter yonseiensis TaxID=1144680 RepID=A0A934VD85_9BACT|nr:DedA family protein [Luteolibacter yonseiensis]MBK1817299.1 DedA family protein [Luteolibacter yonseiensis]